MKYQNSNVYFKKIGLKKQKFHDYFDDKLKAIKVILECKPLSYYLDLPY